MHRYYGFAFSKFCLELNTPRCGSVLHLVPVLQQESFSRSLSLTCGTDQTNGKESPFPAHLAERLVLEQLLLSTLSRGETSFGVSPSRGVLSSCLVGLQDKTLLTVGSVIWQGVVGGWDTP